MGKIKEIIKNEPVVRREQILRLQNYLCDPGRFSVLLLGDRGTGKSHWIYKLKEFNSEKSHLKHIHEINSVLAEPSAAYWEKQLKLSDQGILLLNDVENLVPQNQEILFEALSTLSGAKYGLKRKKYECRLVFTSTYDIRTLRDSTKILSNKFFDRISQLVVRLPSFSNIDGSIWSDFESTWRKMEFPITELPDKSFATWLSSNKSRLHGNFRDLDKIAINWRNFQLSGLEVEKIRGSVTSEFLSTYHFPEHKSEASNAFYINPEQDYSTEILPNFRKFIKNFAKELCGGNLRKGKDGKTFGVPYRTMEKW